MNLKISPLKVHFVVVRPKLTRIDWTEAESQSQYMKQTAGDNAQPLWAEEWEDETEETDFAVQLK